MPDGNLTWILQPGGDGARLVVSNGLEPLPDDGSATLVRRVLSDPDVGFVVTSSPGVGGVNYVWLRIGESPLHRGTRKQSRRWLNLSQGSSERAAIEALVTHRMLHAVWIEDRFEVDYELPERLQRQLQRALDLVGTVTAEQMYWDRLKTGAAIDELTSFGITDTRRAPSRRVAQPPPTRIPFFAPRSGLLPRDGRPTIAGHRLPAGRRNPGRSPVYWITDARISDAAGVAATLADAFAETGLWPLIWNSNDGGSPWDYISLDSTVDGIADIDVAQLFNDGWNNAIEEQRPSQAPFGESFPGLTPRLSPPYVDNPFHALAAVGNREGCLVIVPVNRPADAIARIGGLASEVSGEAISAALRSFEERFAATLVAISPSIARVAAPSIHDHDRALRIAAELWAFCPPIDPYTIEGIANELITPSSQPAVSTSIRPDLWPIGWYD